MECFTGVRRSGNGTGTGISLKWNWIFTGTILEFQSSGAECSLWNWKDSFELV